MQMDKKQLKEGVLLVTTKGDYLNFSYLQASKALPEGLVTSNWIRIWLGSSKKLAC